MNLLYTLDILANILIAITLARLTWRIIWRDPTHGLVITLVMCFSYVIAYDFCGLGDENLQGFGLRQDGKDYSARLYDIHVTRHPHLYPPSVTNDTTWTVTDSIIVH